MPAPNVRQIPDWTPITPQEASLFPAEPQTVPSRLLISNPAGGMRSIRGIDADAAQIHFLQAEEAP